MEGRDERGLLREAEEFFDGSPQGRALFVAVASAVASIGDAEYRVTRSQIAFRRRRGFAWVWRPGRYLKTDVPAVLSIALPSEIDSVRFKSVVHPSPNVWMHHLELRDTMQVDDEVRGWLAAAYANAA
jgi:hypothetical protein